MPIVYIIISRCAWFYRALVNWFRICIPAPPLFKIEAKPSVDTWCASVNQRRVRKAQRRAARAGDRFAFA